jgi:hypothetical protein
MNVYLDTSGLNYLVDNYNREIMLEIESRNIGFYFSAINLWEVLLNSNQLRKEELIYWGQLYCDENLIKSPSEILIDYINLNCPVGDRKEFALDPFTKLDIGKTWKNIHGRIDRTIPIDTESLKEYSKGVHMLSKKMKSIVNAMSADDYENQEKDIFYLSAKRINDKYNLPWQNDSKKLSIISVILACFILCIGVEMDKSIIEIFWNKLKIIDPFDRLEYLIGKYPILFKRGPLVEMSYMSLTQISMQNSKSRGMLIDCFHVIYAYYADLFVTGDRHFKKFMTKIDHDGFKNIVLTDVFDDNLKNFNR